MTRMTFPTTMLSLLTTPKRKKPKPLPRLPELQFPSLEAVEHEPLPQAARLLLLPNLPRSVVGPRKQQLKRKTRMKNQTWTCFSTTTRAKVCSSLKQKCPRRLLLEQLPQPRVLAQSQPQRVSRSSTSPRQAGLNQAEQLRRRSR